MKVVHIPSKLHENVYFPATLKVIKFYVPAESLPFNPPKPNRMYHSYHLYQSISILGWVFSLSVKI